MTMIMTHDHQIDTIIKKQVEQYTQFLNKKIGTSCAMFTEKINMSKDYTIAVAIAHIF